MGAVDLDEEAVAGVFKISSARRLRSRKHFGNASSHSLEETTAAKDDRLRNRVTASNNRSNSGNHGHSASLSRSK
jgi:hypothetical protein